jgi:hypothetical protein
LVEKTKHSRLPIKSIEELKAAAEAICGLPQKPQLDDEIVAAIKWVDGTVIDGVGKCRLNKEAMSRLIYRLKILNWYYMNYYFNL